MRKVLGLVLCFVFALAGRCFAEAPPKHALEIGPEFYFLSYKEPGEMKESGMMYGVSGSYTRHNSKNMMFRAELSGAGGIVEYENSGTMDDIPDFAFEARGLLGLDFNTTEKLILTPYVGVGYRYLNDDSSGKGTTTGQAGYERESNYLYLPIGVEGDMRLSDDWSLAPKVEFDIFILGRQISHLSDANPAFGDVTSDQDSGYGVRGSVRFVRSGEKVDLVIEPFIRYWNIDKSKDSSVTYSGVIVGYGYEPKNNTTEYGVKIGVKF
jgi:hypothetical protein